MNETRPTRQEIVRLLRIKGAMTAKDLASALNITSMGVRRHLLGLERDGLVRVSSRHQPAGRPTFTYHLTGQGFESFPKNYDLLANQLLDATQAREGPPGVSELFARRMDQLVAQYEPRMRGKDLAGRVAELAKIQDENGYMALWRKVRGGYLLKEQNCAIYKVACRFQQACQYEIELFRRLLDADIKRVEHQIAGGLACSYFISENRQSSRLRSRASRTNSA